MPSLEKLKDRWMMKRHDPSEDDLVHRFQQAIDERETVFRNVAQYYIGHRTLPDWPMRDHEWRLIWFRFAHELRLARARVASNKGE